jgi:hypothetical protein
MDFTNIKDVMEIGEYLSSFKKSELRTINDYLLKIRNLGVVNMFQSGDFLMMTKQYFLDFMRLKSYEREYDENEVEEISDLIGEVREIMIRAGVRMVENKNTDTNVRSVQAAIKTLIRSTLKYYMKGLFKI